MSRAHVLDRLDLDSYVTTIDAAFADCDENMLLRLTGDRPDLGMLPLDRRHPLEELLGFEAPPSWQALGLRCSGQAHRIGDLVDIHSGDFHLADAPSRGRPVEIRFTLLVDREGRGAGVLRDRHGATGLSGTPEGLLGDTCRRVLRLPTTAPPASTAELWLRVWLDRLVESVAGDDGDGDSDARGLAGLAALHPAVLGFTALAVPDILAALTSPDEVTSPDEIADATRLLASWWTWSRLRRVPDVVDTGGPPLSPQLAAWMDDGMFARWLLADLPPLGMLRKQLARMLPPPVVRDVDQTLAICGVPAPEDRR